MGRKAKHLTIADLVTITLGGLTPTQPQNLQNALGQHTASRLVSYAKAELARRAKATERAKDAREAK